MARRRKRHSPEQIIRKLQQADGLLAVGKTIGQPVEVLSLSFEHPVVWHPSKRRRAAEPGGRSERLRPVRLREPYRLPRLTPILTLPAL